jgi:hypothetical protein
MSSTVEVAIPVDAEAAHALKSPERREAAGRIISDLLKSGRTRSLLEEAIADAKNGARSLGLTDGDINAELKAWRSERKT